MLIQTGYGSTSLTSLSTVPAEIHFFVDVLLGRMGWNGQSWQLDHNKGVSTSCPEPSASAMVHDPLGNPLISKPVFQNAHRIVSVRCVLDSSKLTAYTRHARGKQRSGKTLGKAQGGDKSIFLKKGKCNYTNVGVRPQTGNANKNEVGHSRLFRQFWKA